MKRPGFFLFALVAMMLIAFGTAAVAETEYAQYKSECLESIGYAAQSVTVTAADIAEKEMNGFYEEDGVFYTSDNGYVEFLVNAPENALYAVRISYIPGSDSNTDSGRSSGGDIQRALYVNGELPYKEAAQLVFTRMWNDKDRTYKTVKGNQPFPSQVETPEKRTVYMTDSTGYIPEELLIHLEEGENRVRLVSVREGMFVTEITFCAPPERPAYDEYVKALTDGGAKQYNGAAIKVQAEDAALKSSPSFYPLNDRTSPLTEPYHFTNIVLNMIGGSAWNEPGEWISWDVEVPEAGLYKIAFRFRQNELRGLYATRKLYVNGEVPFKEAEDIRFNYDSDWLVRTLGETDTDGNTVKEFWIYLNKGVNRITLEVSLGELGPIIKELNKVTSDLNALYRDIVVVTGSSPDTYRDYQLFTRIPELPEKLTALRDRVSELCDELTALTGSHSERTAGMTRLLSIMDELIPDERKVVSKLGVYKECVTSMGKAVLDLTNQPLKLDYMVVYGENKPSMREEANFFEGAWHSIRAFAGSFYNDYNVSSSVDSKNAKEIDVWLSTGRDQFNVIRRLINESFETEYGVKVNLKLIGSDVVLPATATGNGPDVTIQIGNSAPVNFAFRDAALDLTQFEDFEEVAARFHPAAITSFEFNGGVFGLPDQMSFPVLYYRTDILESLGLSVPETWSDLLDMIPVLEQNNMSIYLDTNPVSTLGASLSMGSGRAINTVFLSLLYQMNGDLYNEDGTETLLGSPEANDAFKMWTKFYTQHDFSKDIDFATRFRIGEIPVGVLDLSYYNTLTVSAPEIRGSWSIAPVPGMKQADGTIGHDIPCVTSAAMIIKNMVEDNGTKQEAWDFLKWWTSESTQTLYAQEMEAVLGTAGKYLVANLASYKKAEWPNEFRDQLVDMLDELHGIPQIPGGYITGRYLYNAFITVVTDYDNAADILFEQNELINREIAKKTNEYRQRMADE